MRLDVRWQAVEVRFREQPAYLDARIFISQPSVRVFLPAEPRPQQTAERTIPADARVFRVGSLPEGLRDLFALDLERFFVRTGELYLVDLARPERPLMWLSRLELGIENVATRTRLLEGFPTLLTVRGRVGRTGQLSAFVSADPLVGGLEFSGRASITGLDIRELAPLLLPAANVRATQGAVDVFVVFTSERGRIRGAVKPIVRDLEVAPAGKGFLAWIRALTVDLAADLLSGRGDALATVIPIEGELREPDIQLWPAIFGVLYNAFQAGFAASYAGLPPERAPVRANPFEQGWRVLIQGERPRAQPSGPSAGNVVTSPPRLSPDRGDIPTAYSPAGLMRPGAEPAIQTALLRRGLLAKGYQPGELDPPTQQALRRLQAAAALPETGLPSYSTIEALGLDPATIFQRASRSVTVR